MRASSAPGGSPFKPNWAQQRDITLAIIGWIVVTAIVIWAASHIIGSLLVLLLAALLAYALTPAVRFLTRYIPRPIAIVIVYVAVVSAMAALGYLLVSTAVTQLGGLSTRIETLLQPGSTSASEPIINALGHFGISRSQVQGAGQHLINSAQGAAASLVPLLAGFFSGVLDTVLVTVLSIYLLVDGERVVRWLKTGAPLKYRSGVNFTLNTLERVIGGYIRGQFILSTLIGVLVGLGMGLIFQLPYAVLLGVIAFVIEFIPIVGVFVSGALCLLVALISHGPVLAVFVLAYFVGVHIIEGDVVGPRVVGKAVGVHPAVSIFALLAGAELFGIWGALFASPLAGVTQAVLTEMWRQWRDAHANQFPEEYGGVVVPVTTAEAVIAPDMTMPVRGRLPRMSDEVDEGATKAISQQSAPPYRP